MSDTERIPEYFVRGLSHIELLGSYARHILYTEKTTRRGTILRVPIVHIIFPNAALPEAMAKCMSIPLEEPASHARRLLPHWRH